MPVTGSVVEINESLSESPEQVNEDPYGKGWMIAVNVANTSELDGLLTAAEYEDYIKEETSE
jgi:glycine cleavage system H protein